MAWAAQLDERAARAPAHASPLAGAVLNALLIVTLGLTVAVGGPQALSGWHVALGVDGALAAMIGSTRRAGTLHVR